VRPEDELDELELAAENERRRDHGEPPLSPLQKAVARNTVTAEDVADLPDRIRALRLPPPSVSSPLERAARDLAAPPGDYDRSRDEIERMELEERYDP
jgi:hypothetical protein